VGGGKMKLACSSPMVPAETLTQKAELLKQWGYAGIAIFFDYKDWNDGVLEELLSLESRTGIVPCEFVLTGEVYGRLMDSDPDIRARAKATYIEAATICTRIGANTSVEFEYKIQDPMPLFDPYRKLDATQFATFVELYKELLAVVQTSNSGVLLEPLNRYESLFLNSVADCGEVLRAVDSPNAGLLFDFFHSSIEERDLVDSIHTAGDLIRHVHLGDNNRLLPGMGNINWKRSFDALKEVGYAGFVNLECSTSGDAHQTLPDVAEYITTLIDA
jgi:sugar phosphate isomerase/epimerase